MKIAALMPLSILYGLGIGLRNFMFDIGFLREKSFKIPVVSVGNLSVGGTGKTPMVIRIAEHFSSHGKKVAVLSRGYKRSSTGFHWVNLEENWKKFGDEPCLIQWKLKGKCLVAVDETRVHGIEKILQEKPEIDLILLDDAFQHRYVKPKLNILLCNFYQPFFDDNMLPAGRLREGPKHAKRADIVVVTKCPENMSPELKESYLKKIRRYCSLDIPVFFSSIGYGKLLPLFEQTLTQPTPGMTMVVTGIENPTPMYTYLQQQGWEIQALAYPDHFQFEERHIHKIVQEWQKLPQNTKIITTEKDGVRLREFHMLKTMDVFTLPIESTMEDWQIFEEFISKKIFNS